MHGPRFIREDVLTQHDVRLGAAMRGVQAGVDHRAGAGAALFGGLEEGDERAGPEGAGGEEGGERGESAGYVHVVAAGV